MAAAAMNREATGCEIAPWRLNLLRCGYLLLAAGLGATIWPEILASASGWSLSGGVMISMLGALSALSVLGLRHPLSMLPVLFFELAWKALWLARVALPLWSAGRLDASHMETAFECLMVVVFLPIIPWDHVWRTYVRAPGAPFSRKW